MTIRQERIRELIRNHLSQLLMVEVTDPALQGITVTDIKLDREIEYADIYVHALGNDSRREEVLAGLKRANGFLRSSLAKRLRIRQMPVLHFHWDKTLEMGDHMDKLLDSLKEETPNADQTADAIPDEIED